MWFTIEQRHQTVTAGCCKGSKFACATWFAHDFMRWLAGNQGRFARVVRLVPDHRIRSDPRRKNVEELVRNWVQPKPDRWRQQLWIGAP
jgi:hypothetical protein